MLQSGKVEKRTKMWKIELMRQILIKTDLAIEAEVHILKS